MKQILLLSSVIVFLSAFLAAQNVIENPGFEEWEDAGTVIDEPVNWSSIKTSDGGDFINNAAPVVWDISDDAHTGNHSIKLTNVATIGSIIATGTITNGRIHAELNPAASFSYTDPDVADWHTTLTERPDSIAVWAKYTPQGSDTARIQAVLHVGEGTIPANPQNEDNWIAYAQLDITGTVDTWTRFVVPFEYYSQDNPEYILLILTSGAGLIPVEGSTVLYDDVELIYGPNSIGEGKDEVYSLYSYGNTIYFDTEKNNGSAFFEIISMDGSVVLTQKISDHQSSLKVNVPNGFYIARITTNEQSYSRKLFIQQ